MKFYYKKEISSTIYVVYYKNTYYEINADDVIESSTELDGVIDFRDNYIEILPNDSFKNKYINKIKSYRRLKLIDEI